MVRSVKLIGNKTPIGSRETEIEGTTHKGLNVLCPWESHLYNNARRHIAPNRGVIASGFVV